ncbi:MAG: hypothetical protein C4294_18545 [Nitrospiraceae bacterium]
MIKDNGTNNTSMKKQAATNGIILVLLFMIIVQIKGIGDNLAAYREQAVKEKLSKSSMQVLQRDTKPTLEKDLVYEKGAK